MNIRQLGGDWLFKDLWGFRQMPPEDVSLIFGKAILVCAYGGGKLAPEERAWVVGYFTAIGFSEAFITELEQYDPKDHIEDLMGLISNTLITAQPDSRLALIYDGVRAASADGVLDEGEISALKRLAATIDISAVEVEKVIAAHAAEVRAKRARIALCFPDGTPF